jgi:ubiquinone/menaquinone biosynthesis C-methylase UbiE
MEKQYQSKASNILPVLRTKAEARDYYDRISKIYDYMTGAFERRFAERALKRLSIKEGESVLEIGFGSGNCLKRVAVSIGSTGKAHGIDISAGMLNVTRSKLAKSRLLDRVQLYSGDASNLPYGDSTFDAAFMSYTLELFNTDEIPRVLEEVLRVLKPKGRLGVAGMSKENGKSTMLRVYEWAHRKWPKYVDCRPIYVEQSLRNAGYEIRSREKAKLFGLPNEIVIAVKA